MPVVSVQSPSHGARGPSPASASDPAADRALAMLGARLAERPYARRGAPSADRVIRVLLVEPQALVRAALRQLPAPFREAVVLVDLQERPYAEAARIAGVQINTLRTRLHRARGKLAVLLGAVDGSRG